ncbi:MAG: Ig-like domain-containing protein [Flavobacteriales bacterium]|nr:Ig-like domain-containing protein [Flavobacteriales bacterium]
MRYTGARTALLTLILAACAQVREITGGDKDVDAPTLVRATPNALTTGFNSDVIVLEFNERVQLDRVRERLLISPPLDVAPDVRITGAREVAIRLNAPLRPRTTYSFLIGEAIKDLTEGNAASGLTYVVSTGDALDSMQVMGRVNNAYTELPEKDVLVMLYDALDTVTIRTGRPAYATRTGADGSFHIKYVREGTYRLFALRDKNSNYRYDLPNEEVAFLKGPISLSASDTVVPMHMLRLFQEASAVQQVRGSKVIADGALQVILARPARTLSLRDVTRTGSSLRWSTEWNATRDTVLFWPSDTTDLMSGRYELRSDTILDTLRYRPVQRMPYFTVLRSRSTETAEGVRLTFHASRPLAQLAPDRFSLLTDSVAHPFTVGRDSLDDRLVHLTTMLPAGGAAQLTVLPKAVTDIYGGHNDTLRIGIGKASEQSTGTLRVALEVDSTMQGTLILQLLTMQDRLVEEADLVEGERSITWERLSPGNHRIRLIEDRNGNGRWDTGILDLGIQPERIRVHPDEVNVRAAWDLGVDWKIR